MDGAQQLQELYKYDLWANRHIVDVLKGQLFDKSKNCLGLFAHIGAAQQVWYNRINENPAEDIELWPRNNSTDKSLQTLKKLHPHWLSLITNDGLFDRNVTYANSKGVTFTTPLGGILHHVIIHGQHHRAQIASLLRQSGINPPATDFIFYLRNNP